MNRFSVAALVVLIIGVLSGTAIYLSADEPEPSAYIIIGDTAYPYDPAMSKPYVRQLERFGGKSAVLFDEFNRWFAALWQGKALGVTIIWLSVGGALLLYWIARRERR